MKKTVINLIALSAIAIALFFSTGCKKTSDTGSNYVLTGIGDTTNTPLITFSYGLNDKLLRLTLGQTSYYDYFYNGDQLVYRLNTSGGTISAIDSFHYDGQNHLVEMDDYDASSNLKNFTLSFTYNSDNTLNSAITTNIGSGTDVSYNYTYASGKLTERDDYQKSGGTFKLSVKNEYLAYDNHFNPLTDVIKTYLPDAFSASFILVGEPNDPTSSKVTNYDLTTGNPTSFTTTTATYTYNSLGLPTSVTVMQSGSATQTLTFFYSKK